MENREKELLSEGFSVVSRHLIMDKDLNHYGNLFGGALLYMVDESSYLFTTEAVGYANLVTANMENVNFRAPAHRGDNIQIYCRVVEKRRSSVKVETRVFVYTPLTHHRGEIISCSLTFVALKDGKPYPYFTSAEYLEWLEKEKS